MLSKDFTQSNPELMKVEPPETKEKQDEKDEKLRKKMGGKKASAGEIATKLDTQKRLQQFDRFNQDFVDTYMQERY